MEPRGIFSMAVPAEVLAAALAEDRSRRSRPGAVPDYCFTADGRRMLYDVKRISFCPSRYWPTVAVASSRGGALEYRASLVRTEYEAGRRQLLRSMPAQLPGTDGRGRRPSRSTDGSRYPRLVSSGSRLGLRQHCLRGVQGGWRPPCSGALLNRPRAGPALVCDL